MLLALLSACAESQKKSVVAGAGESNCVAAYLTGAELQLETDSQRAEITRALRDMLEKSPEQLKASRYADYQGRPGAWSAVELLRRYFVPDRPRSLNEECFYRDVSEARAAIQKHLNALRTTVKP
jgi:hypothetical protein